MSDCRLAGEMVWGQDIKKIQRNLDWLRHREELKEHVVHKLMLYLESPDSMNLNEADRGFLTSLIAS
jgi:ribosomal protein L19E